MQHKNALEEYDHQENHGGGGDVDGFRGLLRHKYGNAARGWRIAIAPHADLEGNDHSRAGNKATLYSDFCAGLKRIGFSGNGRSVWKALSKGKSSIWLEDLDPKLARSLDVVARGIAEKYPGGTHQAWRDIQSDHAAKVTADEFEEFLITQDLLGDDPDLIRVRQVFECIALNGGGKFSREEFRFLDHWGHRRLGLALPPLPVRKDPWAEKEHWAPPPQKPPHVPDLKDFRKFLEEKFGSPARGWRVALDLKVSGTLSPSEFGMACRQMGWQHPCSTSSKLWMELISEGGGTINLRGVDPETCNAIDSMVDNILKNYGDLESFWAEVLDPDGDGICSKAEWIQAISGQNGITAHDAGLIFTALDIVNCGWVAFAEISFIDDFIPYQDDGWEDEHAAMMMMDSRLFSSMSSGSLPMVDPMSPQMSTWSGVSLADSGAASMSKSQTMSKLDLHLGSTQRSSRSMQNRQYANSHMAKYRWMGFAAAAHTRSMSEGSTWSHYKKEVEPKMPTVGGTPMSDVFRFTNEFYREGCRRLQYHHAKQLENASRGDLSPRSERTAKSSAQGSGKKSGKS